MAVSAKFYGNAFVSAFNGLIDFDTDTIKVALCTASYTPNQDTHDFFNDVTNEITGTGYTAGGATLGSAALTYDGASNTVKLDGADTSWAASTLVARYAVIYKSTGTASTSPLIAYADFGADFTSSNGTFLITWDAAGIATVTVS